MRKAIGIVAGGVALLALWSSDFEAGYGPPVAANRPPVAQKPSAGRDPVMETPNEWVAAPTPGPSPSGPISPSPWPALPGGSPLVSTWPPPEMAPANGVFALLALAMADDREVILSAKAALDAFPRPLPGDQSTAREKNHAGMDALKAGAYETAIAQLNEGMRADPGDAAIRRNLGRALTMFGRLDDARNALVDSVTLDPARAMAWADLGLVLARQGEQDLAAAAFMASVAVSKPEDKAVEHLHMLSRSDADPGVMTAAGKALESRTIRDATERMPPS